ncbi:hypothetical protein AB9P05_23810 [Roseivirga sp. BDSF3-8]|uniref:hypothetical protein n=1 Tax=Roseivirga sp. BDSF3-8 TaxID=3241598 RepID=UPI0035325480
MVEGLRELKPYLMSELFINFIGQEYINGEPFDWDKLLYYMAWEGLHKTKTFNEEIEEKGLNEEYLIYVKSVDMESATYKCK